MDTSPAETPTSVPRRLDIGPYPGDAANEVHIAYFDSLRDCPYVHHYLARGSFLLDHETYHALCHAGRVIGEADQRWHARQGGEPTGCPYCPEMEALLRLLRL